MPPQESNLLGRESCIPSLQRRQSMSAPSSPVATLFPDIDRDRAFYHTPQPPPRSRQLSCTKRVYDSPLIDSTCLHGQPPKELLQRHDDRYSYMSALAGNHCQDASTFYVNPQRLSTPRALQAGMMKQAALRVTTLHLPILTHDENGTSKPNDNDDSLTELPLWLNAIVATFPNLRHLHLQKKETVDANDDELADSDHSANPSDKYAAAAGNDDSLSEKEKAQEIHAVRRLYVLYRINALESLDGKPFSSQEREFASFKSNRQHVQDHKQSQQPQPNHQLHSPPNHQSWTEQADAKMTAHSVAAHEACLLDGEDDDDDENEDPMPFSLSPIRLPLPRHRRPLGIESAVEIDVNGQPHCAAAPERPNSLGRQTCRSAGVGGAGEDHVIRSPPRLSDLWEYESVESSAVVCEWTAACGAIPLPYFRKLPTVTNHHRDLAKSKFQLKYKRQDMAAGQAQIPTRRAANARVPTAAAAAPLEVFEATLSSMKPALSPGNGNGRQAFFEPMVVLSPKLTVGDDGVAAPPLPVSQSNSPCCSSPSSHPSDKPRIMSASQSLSSPFPLQFRIRASASSVTDDCDSTPKSDVLLSDWGKQELKITTDFEGVVDEVNLPILPPPPPRDAVMETIEDPIPLSRTQSSPSKLPSALRKNRLTPPPIVTKRELPPPGPPGRRQRNILGAPVASVVAGTGTRTASSTIPCCDSTTKASSQKVGRRSHKWREKLSARSSSIMDSMDDENVGFASSDDEDFSP